MRSALMSEGDALAPTRERRAGRWLRAALGAFSGLTSGWIVSVLLVPGDFFQFDPRTIICLVGAVLLGTYAGFRARVRWKQVLIAIWFGLSIVYWLLAPDGWWVHSLQPRRGSVTVPR